MARLVERLNQWGVEKEKNGGSSGLSDSEKTETLELVQGP